MQFIERRPVNAADSHKKIKSEIELVSVSLSRYISRTLSPLGMTTFVMSLWSS